MPRYRPHTLLTLAALAAGCSSGSRPDINEGGVLNLCDDVQRCTPDVHGVCQHTCASDPGPRLVECAKAELPFEFMKPLLWTFDEQAMPGVVEPLARGMYSYTDNSTTIKTFTVANNQDPTKRSPKTWEPRTATLPRCSDKPNDNNQAIHIQGGPFLSWGGGVGIGLKNYPSVVGSVAAADAMMDVSEWEGVSFWARRGPDSQAGFRVLVGDKYTDDDISYLMYHEDPGADLFCKRVRECACLNHQACAPVPLDRANGGTGDITNPDIPNECRPVVGHLRPDEQEMTFCGTPEVISGTAAGSQGASQCNTCLQSRCDERWPAYPDDKASPTAPDGTDRQFYGKPCSPYTLRPGISSYFCFDPATERPAESTEQCGDHWTRVVNLSNEWQFYTVPFSAMQQQGWAQRTGKLDLTSVSVVRFTWDGGWIDYWIDDVSFYKHKPPTP